MERLADISQFESLMNAGNNPPAHSVTSTENGRLSNYIGDKIADRYIFRYGRDMVNKKNYEATVEVGKKAASWLREHRDKLNKHIEPNADGRRFLYTEDSPRYLELGFADFGRFCANLDIDISQLMDDLNIEFSTDSKERPWADPTATTICLSPSAHYPKSVTHELIHLLFQYPQVAKSIQDRFNIPGRKGSYEDHQQTFPHDKLRAWIAGDDYAGKEYDLREGEEYPHSEYLSMFSDKYGVGELPMLYALDIKRLLRKINKAVKKETEKNNKTAEPKMEVAYA